MKHLQLTLDSPAANVAIDEAILETAEAGESNSEILRLWEPNQPIVVLGRSSAVESEVNLQSCRNDAITIVRRCSGGATVLTAPGCLMYAVLLSYDLHPELRMLDNAHRFVMAKIQSAISNCGIASEFEGTCDLTIDHRKVSGNALRCKKHWLLYHGTLICDSMNLDLISRYLGMPKRQPEYRRQRSHAEFLTRMPVTCEQLSAALLNVWDCDTLQAQWPNEMTNELVHTKYDRNDWTHKI